MSHKQADRKPVISVIIPAYQAEQYLKQAAESVFMQTCKEPVELLIIDDCSTDLTRQVAEEIQEIYSHVRYLHQESRQGVAAARNRGLEEARGKYVAFLDADDWWTKDKLKLQMACIARTKAVLCYTGRELVNPDGSPTGRVIHAPKRVTYRELLRTNVIPCSSVVMRTDIAREFQFLHDEYHEDYLLWLRALRKYGAAYGIDVPALKCRLSEGGKSRNKRKSAAMQYGSYRCLGYGRLRSLYYMIFYTLNGFRKYMSFKKREILHWEGSSKT